LENHVASMVCKLDPLSAAHCRGQLELGTVDADEVNLALWTELQRHCRWQRQPQRVSEQLHTWLSRLHTVDLGTVHQDHAIMRTCWTGCQRDVRGLVCFRFRIRACDSKSA